MNYTPLRKHAWFAVIGGIVAAFMSIMDIQITNAAIGQIQHAINSPIADGSWISSSYLIAEIVAIPITNFWLNWLGQRKVAILFCIMFIVGSFLCSEAWNLNSLIIFRVIQGFAAGVLMALAYVIIITSLSDPKDKQLAIILFGAIVSVAPTIGPLLGGVVTSFLSWKFLFYINIPFGVISIILLLIGRLPSTSGGRNKVDLIGIISIAIGLACLQYVLEEGYKFSWFNSYSIIILSCLAIVCLLFFVINELKNEAPLVNLRLFKNFKFFIACCGSTIGGGMMFSFFFIVPYFLIEVYSYTPGEISQFLMWIGFAQLFMLMFARKILKKLNVYFMIAIGFLLFSASIFLWSTFSNSIYQPLVIVSAILRGMSSTFFLTPLGILATTSVAEKDAPSASILYNITRSLGGAVGVAVITTYVSMRKDWYFSQINDLMQSYRLAFADSFRVLFIILLGSSLLFIIIWCLYKTKIIDNANSG